MHTMELSTVYALLPYDDDGHTPLHFLKAVYTQNDARAQSMIEFINTPIWGGTPLYWMRETPHAVQWLQQHGAEMKEPSPPISALVDAVLENDYTGVMETEYDFMMATETKFDPKINTMRVDHHTLLIWALIFDCQFKQTELPRTTPLLQNLNRRARNAKEASGYTALMYAFMLPWTGGTATRDACVQKVLLRTNATDDLWDGTHTFITYLLQTPGCGNILSQSIGNTFFVRAQHKIWAAEHGLDEYMEWMLRHCDDNGSALDIIYRRLPVGNISADSLFQSAWKKIRDAPSSVTNVPKYVEQVKMLTRHITKTKLADYIHEMLTHNRWLYFHGNALMLKNLLFHGDHPETIQRLQNKPPCVIDTHNKALIELRLYTFDNQNSTVFAWFRARGIGFVLQNISLRKLAISDSEDRLMRQTFHFFDDVRDQIGVFDSVYEPRRIDHPRCKEHIQRIRFTVNLESGYAIDRQITNADSKYVCPVCRNVSNRLVCISVPQVRNIIRVREEIRALEANVDESRVEKIRNQLAKLDNSEKQAENHLALEIKRAAAAERTAQRAAAAEYKNDTAEYDKEVAGLNLRSRQHVLKRNKKTAEGAKEKLKKQRKRVTVIETLKF